MKKIILMLMLVAVFLALCSCGNSSATQNKQKSMHVVQEYNNGIIVADMETGVMYWESEGQYNRGILTLLVNADGTPKTYNEVGE